MFHIETVRKQKHSDISRL